MATYRIETTGGVYEIETEDAKAGSPEWAGQRRDQIAANSEKYLPQQEPQGYDFSLGGFAQGVSNVATSLFDAGKRILTPPETTGDRIAAAVAGPAGPMALDMIRSHVETGKKAVNAAREGRGSEAVGYGVATALPGVGPMVAGAAEKAGEGKFSEAAGELVAGALVPKAIKGPGKILTKSGRAEISTAVATQAERAHIAAFGPPK